MTEPFHLEPLIYVITKGPDFITYDDGPSRNSGIGEIPSQRKYLLTFLVVGDSEQGGGFMHYPVLDSLIFMDSA